MEKILTALATAATPENVGLALTLALVLLAKTKYVNEATRKTIAKMLEDGAPVGEIAASTTATAGKVLSIKREIEAFGASPDTNKKKIQRAARAALRGWLKF